MHAKKLHKSNRVSKGKRYSYNLLFLTTKLKFTEDLQTNNSIHDSIQNVGELKRSPCKKYTIQNIPKRKNLALKIANIFVKDLQKHVFF